MMFGTLLKKQMLDISQSFLRSKGKARLYGASAAAMVVLACIVVLIIGGIVLIVAFALSPLITAGMSWIYFLIMSAAAAALGVFGSVFTTYASMYEAGDNDLLLSLPIPIRYILAVRLAGVYLSGLMYSMIVFIPALIIYYICAAPSPADIIGTIVFAADLSVMILVISCLLGWLMAKVSSRLRHRSIGAVIAVLALLGAYYYIYFKADELLSGFLNNAESYGSSIAEKIPVLYIIGQAASGSPAALAAVVPVTAVLFALTVYVLSKTFLSLSVSVPGTSKKAYHGEKARAGSVSAALLRKEFGRFVSSPAYMLNCAMGSVFLIAAGAACLFKGVTLVENIGMLGLNSDFISVFAALGVCMLMSSNDITAPSVSLEGSNLWILRSLPVEPRAVMRAKIMLHMLITYIPALICTACICVLLRPSFVMALLTAALQFVYCILSAAFGLVMNLRDPHLQWVSEMHVIKRNFSIIIVVCGGWILTAFLTVLYIPLSGTVPAALYLLVCLLGFAAAAAYMLRWLAARGAGIYESL